MTKLSAKQARDLERADTKRIRARAEAIAKTFPSRVRPFTRGRFLILAIRAVEKYLAHLPVGRVQRRKHRTTGENRHRGTAHRPADAIRHGLIGDLYDAYMTARASEAPDDLPDPDLVRGFAKTADAVLTAARLSPITEHEQTSIREQIKAFSALI